MRMKLERILTVVIAVLIWTFICTQAFIFVRHANATQIIGWLTLTVVLITVGILSAIFPSVKRFIDAAFAKYWRFLFWYCLFLLPFLPFRWLYQIVSTYLSPWLQVLVLTLWGTCLFVAIWYLVLEKNRIRLFDWLRDKVGFFAPLAYSFNLMWIAIFFFSSVTYPLVHSEVLHWTLPAGQNITPEAIMDFYFWHFLDAVPVFAITHTLGWKEPLTYDNGAVGFLLLLFKIIAISPTIGAFIWYWGHIGKEGKAENIKRPAPKRVHRTYHRKSHLSR